MSPGSGTDAGAWHTDHTDTRSAARSGGDTAYEGEDVQLGVGNIVPNQADQLLTHTGAGRSGGNCRVETAQQIPHGQVGAERRQRDCQGAGRDGGLSVSLNFHRNILLPLADAVVPEERTLNR